MSTVNVSTHEWARAQAAALEHYGCHLLVKSHGVRMSAASVAVLHLWRAAWEAGALDDILDPENPVDQSRIAGTLLKRCTWVAGQLFPLREPIPVPPSNSLTRARLAVATHTLSQPERILTLLVLDPDSPTKEQP